MAVLPWRIDLDHHQRVVTIGDVHGDMGTFIGTLARAGLVDVPKATMRAALKCHLPAVTTNKDSTLSRWKRPLTPHQASSITWSGGKAAVLFLGDVLDNRRGSHQDIMGVCATAGTQTQILELLYELQSQAAAQQGRVVFILGNHDVANATPGPSTYCDNYAPQYMIPSSRSRGEPATENASEAGYYSTCTKGKSGFSDEHVRHIRWHMHRLHAVAVARVETNSAGSFLVMHGGLTRESLHFFCAKGMVKKYRLVPEEKEHQRNLKRMNALFFDALELRGAARGWDRSLSRRRSRPRHNRSDAMGIVYGHARLMPTMCRPDATDPSCARAMKSLFGTSRVVKAHDTQTTHDRQPDAHCRNTYGLRSASGRGTDLAPFEDADLCKIDVAASRCFSPEETLRTCTETSCAGTARYAFMEVFVYNGLLQRRIHQGVYEFKFD